MRENHNNGFRKERIIYCRNGEEMIKASTGDPSNPLIILGLTEGNIIRLKNDQPIQVTLTSCGVDVPGSIGIIYGQTEHDIEGDLHRAGLITDVTQIIHSKQQDQESAIASEYDKILVATVGLSLSGKSTWAKSQAWPIVCPDAVRLAIHGERFIGRAEPFVWATVKAMVRALFLAGHKIVILDACNTTRKRREDWISREWDTFFKVIDTSREVCERRAREEKEEVLLPVIERMAEQYEPLGDDERQWPEE